MVARLKKPQDAVMRMRESKWESKHDCKRERRDKPNDIGEEKVESTENFQRVTEMKLKMHNLEMDMVEVKSLISKQTQ